MKQLKMKQKKKKDDFLGASLLRNMLADKGVNRAGYSSKDLQSKGRKGIIRAGYGSKLDL